MKAYQVAVSLAPDNLQWQNNLAALQLKHGDTEAFIKRYQSILKQDPTLVDAWFNLGLAYGQMRKTKKARPAWQQVLQQNPDYAAAKAYLEYTANR